MKVFNLGFLLLLPLSALAIALPMPLSHRVIDPVSPSVIGQITKKSDRTWYLYWERSHFNLIIQPQRMYYLYTIDDEKFIVFVDNENNEYKLLIIDPECDDN